MNIYLEETKSSLKNEFIKNYVIDKLHRKCNESIGYSIPSILLANENEKYKNVILEVLKKYGYNFNSFYSGEIIDGSALDDPIISGGLLIKDVIRDDKKITIITEHGNFEVDLLAETLDDSLFLSRKRNKSLIGSCHELTGKMLEKYKMTAITAFCPENFCENIIHSYNIDNDGIVYDVSHNIIMPKDKYERFLQPVKLSEVTYDEYMDSEEYYSFQNHLSSEFPLYSIAKKRTKDVSMKCLKREKILK